MKKLSTGLMLLVLSTITLAQTYLPASVANVNPIITLPAIYPAPASIKLQKGLILISQPVTIIIVPGTDTESVKLISGILKLHGIEDFRISSHLPADLNGTNIVVGSGNAPLLRSALSRCNTTLDNHNEGYTISSANIDKGALIIMAGHDDDGLFHAVQTFRQLMQCSTLPALTIQDHPSMPIRGTIEGFYGTPWSMESRAKHLGFLATVKANTYIYSPKDDPYARDRWREAYPGSTLKELGKLVAIARRNHINFVYAISPGSSVCFSDPADIQFIEHKFDALRAIGIHDFYIALDDIAYTKWNCDLDQKAFGPPSAEAAGIAQSRFLNAVQTSLNAHDPQAHPLIMVPTEYYDAKETPYKAALRKYLDPKIIVQWTGTDVVPPAIAVSDAKAATKAFGRKTLLWDNYPVNDYAQTTGRLLLASYARREAGLSIELSGILSNPMNQEAPSRIAVTGLVAFAWNDKDYDADRTWKYAARFIVGGDNQATTALMTFFDTQHMAPTFGSQPWQPQAPQLKIKLDNVREAIASGDADTRKQAITNLIRFADKFTGVPDIIKSGAIDSDFVQQAQPWLDAMRLWGRALELTAAGLDAANYGNAAAQRYFADAKKIAAEASAIQTIPGVTRPNGPIKIADGVLDKFIADAPTLISTN